MRTIPLALAVLVTTGILVVANTFPANAYGGSSPTDSGGTETAPAAAQADALTPSGYSGNSSVGVVGDTHTLDALVKDTIFGGTLSANVWGANLSAATLNGSGTVNMTGTSAAWTLIDARGTGAAWTLSVSLTKFTSAAVAGDVPAPERTIAASNLAISPGTFALAADTNVAAGQTLATAPYDSDPGTVITNSVKAVTVTPLTYSVSNSAASVSQTLISGIDSTQGSTTGGGAKGDYVFASPVYTLTVPRNAYKSNVLISGASKTISPYTSTITFTVA